MPIKRTATSVQKNAEIALSTINAKIENVLIGSNEEKRSFIERNTKTAVSDYNNFMVGLSKGDLETMALWINSMSAKETASGGLSTQSLRIAYNKLKKVLDKPNTGSQSHLDSSVISSQLFIMYIELTRIVNSDFWEGLTLPTNVVDENTKKRQEFNQSSTRALTENIRQLWIASKAVAEMDIKGFTGDSIADLRTALTAYFENTTQEQHFIKKENEVNSITGKINQRIVLEEQSDRSSVEYLIGTAKNKLFDRKRDGRIAKVLEPFANNFGDIVGSKAITGEVMKQLKDVALGKKPKAYSSKKPAKKLKNSKMTDTISPKLKRGDLAKKSVRMPPLVAKVMRESGSGTEDQISTQKLKSVINKRLPAEVRRNMGRPALINRTGRFSNSAQVLNLKDTPKGISGDYTYALNPYQTFENTGSKRWPVGYNPKALIAKSIRQLAMQYTEQKVTILRRR